MATITVSYYDPELNLDGVSTSALHTVTKSIQPIRDRFQAVLETFQTRTDRGEDAIFEFSFFEALGIPPYAHISLDAHISRNLRSGLKITIVNELLSHYREYFQYPRITSNQRSNYIFFSYNGELDRFAGAELNKIHLFVQHQYILYAVLKLATLRSYYPDNEYSFKFQLFNRTSNLRPEDTGLYDIRADGGIAPTIVIYGASDKVIMTRLLNLVLWLFRGEYERIGLMDEQGSLKLSPFNIRLNRLVSFAVGDRNATLNYMMANITNIGHYTDYTMPNWLTEMQAACKPETREEINRRSQLFIGEDACDEAGAAIDYAAKCRGPRNPSMKYCYLTRMADMLDPRFFVGGRRSRRNRRNRRNKTRRSRKV